MKYDTCILEKPTILTQKHTHANAFTLSILAISITGLRIHGVFEDTAQKPLTKQAARRI